MRYHYRMSRGRTACGQLSHVRNTDVRNDVTCAQCKATSFFRSHGEPGWAIAQRERNLARLRAAVVDVVMEAYRCGLYTLPEGIDAACAALAAATCDKE